MERPRQRTGDLGLFTKGWSWIHNLDSIDVITGHVVTLSLLPYT